MNIIFKIIKILLVYYKQIQQQRPTLVLYLFNIYYNNM